MSKGRVLMAMSGGIDSAISALLLHEQGYEVIGLTMKTWDYETSGVGKKETGCCSLDSINDARKLASDCGFPHTILDIREEFGDSIINNFIDEYIAGRTPNPCILCNTHIKWEALLKRAEENAGRELPLTGEARSALRNMADGDGRFVLTLADDLLTLALPPKAPLNAIDLAKVVQHRAPVYDKDREGHYNLISAVHKSLRGSDPDAALYWVSRMLEGGEDPIYILRRLTRFATEDIGLADPQALQVAINAWDTYDRLGSPEGDLAIAMLVTYLAVSPKSNAIYSAFDKAICAARKTGSLAPPKHILNAPTRMMKELGYGKDYVYDHADHDAFSGQNYFPEGMSREQFYHPVERGFEREINKRLDYWRKLRSEKSGSIRKKRAARIHEQRSKCFCEGGA
mgnify:CR=1 FL=1